METDQVQSTPVQEQPEQPSIALSDLVLLLKLVQITAQRGAIRANEMAEVGAVHDKLVKFLTSAGAIQPEPQAPTEENQNG
jgi:hypothetical protein